MSDVTGLYIHFPFCIKKCNYCDFHSKSLSEGRLDQLHLDYQKQLEMVNALHEENRIKFGKLDTIYIGGGTPALWGREGRRFLAQFLKQFQWDENTEFTIEVNPKSTTIDEIHEWCDIGVNRFSVGVQSLDDTLLHYLDRVHSADEAKDLLRQMGRSGINFSADLMMGLPFSSNRDLIAEAAQLVDLGANHISSYILTVGDNYVHHKSLPSEEQIEQEFLGLSDFMAIQGYEHYEVSNFARKGFRSKHNLKYWNSDSVGAIGPSASGLIALKERHLRYKWELSKCQYSLESVEGEDLKLERFYMAFRSAIGIPLSFFEGEEGMSLIRKWKHEGLVRQYLGRVAATPRGFLLLDSMIDQLFNAKIL